MQKSEKMLTVRQIRAILGNITSISTIYAMISDGRLSPAYKMTGNKGLCVPESAVIEHKNRCRIDLGA